MRGTIVRIFTDKNFGFVQGKEEGFERFLHRGGVSPDGSVPFADLEEGDVIEFDPFESVKGPRAENVRLIAKAGDFQPGYVGEDNDGGPDGFRG